MKGLETEVLITSQLARLWILINILKPKVLRKHLA